MALKKIRSIYLTRTQTKIDKHIECMEDDGWEPVQCSIAYSTCPEDAAVFALIIWEHEDESEELTDGHSSALVNGGGS